MKRGLASLVLGGSLLLGMVGCSETADKTTDKPKVVENKVDEKALAKKMESDYLQVVYEANSSSETASKDMQRLFEKASLHPELLLHEGWKYDLNKAYEQMQKNYDKVRNYPNVPDKYKEAHANLLQGYDYLMQSQPKIMEGVNNMDADKMSEGIELIQKSKEYVNKFTTGITNAPK